jgi:putative addiction module component (TIGR02574 family)
METVMSHVIQDLGIDQLPIEQRVLLVQEIWDSIAREVGLLPPTPDEQLELQSRLTEDDASPGDVVSWDEIEVDSIKRWKP